MSNLTPGLDNYLIMKMLFEIYQRQNVGYQPDEAISLWALVRNRLTQLKGEIDASGSGTSTQT